jgi:trk system potassium uptake protein TrkA
VAGKEDGNVMRFVFIGSSGLSVMTARSLMEQKHEVVIIERNKERIEELTSQIDCGFLHGDGGTPAILKEADPEHTDFLFSLTSNDQTNIISGLIGRSLGFRNVVVKIEDPSYEHICTELGLENAIIPTRTISRFLSDMVQGMDIMEISTMIKDQARFFSFVAGPDHEREIAGLDLPKNARVICFYRDGKFTLAEPDSQLKKGDEVVILAHRDNLAELKERFLATAGSVNVEGLGASVKRVK